jgi:hypothetical protein
MVSGRMRPASRQFNHAVLEEDEVQQRIKKRFIGLV